MRYRQLCCALLVALATLLGISSALGQKSEANCNDANKEVKILEDQRKKYETQQAEAQQRIDNDRRNGRPVRQEDLDAVNDAKERIKSLDKRIDDAKKEADAKCKKEKELCAQKKMTWCDKENRCVDPGYWSCEHCGCGVTR